MSTMLKVFLLAIALGVAGCDQDGPLERAGESLDEAAEDARDELDRAKNNVEDAVDDVEDELN